MPHGFQTLGRTLGGGPPVIEEYTKDAVQATAIFRNDLVSLETDANIAPGGTPGTTRYLGATLNPGGANKKTTHLIVISPDALYEAQDNNDTDGAAAGDIGANANAEFNAGNVNTDVSGHEIDESTIATTATLDLRLHGLLLAPNNAFGSFARVEVTLNKHIFNKEVAGI